MSTGAETGGEGALAGCLERIRALETRVARLEGERNIAPPPPSAEAVAATGAELPDAETTVATVFARVALITFALLGALVLRVLTQQGILAHGPGLILGVVYATALLGAGLLPGRVGRWARTSSLLPSCGLGLIVLIALEGALRSPALIPRAGAMALGGAGALMALAIGVAQNRRGLTAMAAVAGPLGLVALGQEPAGLGLQLMLLVAIAAAAMAASWRGDRGFLRPLSLILTVILLTTGLCLARKQPSSGPEVFRAMLALWGLVLLQHGMARQSLGRAAAWLPAATLWLLAVEPFARIGPAWTTARLVFAAAAIGVTPLVMRRGLASRAFAAGLLLAGALAGSAGAWAADPRGLAAATLALLLWEAGCRWSPGGAAAGSVLLVAAGGFAAVARTLGAGAGHAAGLTSLVVAGLLLGLAERVRRRTPDAGGWLSPVALVAALGTLFASLRAVAEAALDTPGHFQLAQTAILAASAYLLTAAGRRFRRMDLEICGLGCMLLALLKGVLFDLFRLTGPTLLASVVLLGVTSIAVSAALRKKARESGAPPSPG
jgi:hypothetical protein